MNYRTVKKKKTFLTPIILTVLVLVVILVLLLTTPLFSRISQGMNRSGAGLWEAGQSISQVASVGKSLLTHSKRDLILENESLRDQLYAYAGELLALETVQQENGELHRLLNSTKMEYEFVTAKVLARSAQSAYNTVIIQAGTNQGLAIGQKVTAYGTVLLGEVVEVFPTTAKVSLYSSPGSEHQVVVAPLGIQVTATGKGANNFYIELPRDMEVQKGDQLLDTVTGNLLATIQETIFDPREPFQKVLARSPVNVQHLRWVQVIK